MMPAHSPERPKRNSIAGSFRAWLVIALSIASMATSTLAESIVLDPGGESIIETGSPVSSASLASPASIEGLAAEDRVWLLSVRHLDSDACHVRLPARPQVYRLDCRGCKTPSSIDEYFESLDPERPVAFYVHGNRYTAKDAVERGLFTFRNTRHQARPVDWVIWSWPSDRVGVLGYDVRTKAKRCDGQGLLLADVLREHVMRQVPTTLVGFSFGGRVITGAMHALAGGSLGGRRLPPPHYYGSGFDVGLIAPAIEQNWLTERGYHRLATQNINRATVLYNQRDAILKRYWLIERVRGQMALGYSGPTRFAARYDGTPLPVVSRDCSAIVGLEHDELDYYNSRCRAGSAIGQLIDETASRRN